MLRMNKISQLDLSSTTLLFSPFPNPFGQRQRCWPSLAKPFYQWPEAWAFAQAINCQVVSLESVAIEANGCSWRDGGLRARARVHRTCFFINTRKYLCEINMLQLRFKKRILRIYITSVSGRLSTLSNWFSHCLTALGLKWTRILVCLSQ